MDIQTFNKKDGIQKVLARAEKMAKGKAKESKETVGIVANLAIGQMIVGLPSRKYQLKHSRSKLEGFSNWHALRRLAEIHAVWDQRRKMFGERFKVLKPNSGS